MSRSFTGGVRTQSGCVIGILGLGLFRWATIDILLQSSKSGSNLAWPQGLASLTKLASVSWARNNPWAELASKFGEHLPQV